jgi:carbon monoxide dehydrogenase subunit G
MKVSGTATLNASRADVWAALNDPAVLVRTIPGCQRLEEVGPDAYKMTLTAGVASIKGVYTGDVSLSEQQHPDSFVLKAAGAGAPGTVSADVLVRLEEQGPTTTSLTYDADAIVGGMIGGVGQRMLTGVAKKTAGEFFKAIDGHLNGTLPAPDPAAVEPSADRPAMPGVYYDAPTAGEGLSAPVFAKGAVVGAVAALLGVLVGGLLAGRRR